MIKSIFESIAAALRWITGRSEAANAPDVKAAKTAQAQVDQQAKVNQAIADKNVEDTRKALSED